MAIESGGSVERTFLIADIRGYTRFTRERGDAAAARLARAFAVLARDAVAARGGRVIELRGDEALAVFSSPPAAVRAAIDLLATCAEEESADPDLSLHLGVGIDLGEAVQVEDGFRGAALNTAARLCSAADAGQVLVTAAVAARTADAPEVTYVSRGSVELKGFESPIELFEARGNALRLTSDRLRPDELRGGRVPPELETVTPLIGRDYELSWLRGTWRQVRRGRGRVVFLSGQPESGKTRLAAELAAFASTQGALVTYAGAGGVALAMAAIEEEISGPLRPAVLVLDDLDELGEAVANRIESAYEALQAAPVLMLGLARDPEAVPTLQALIARADKLGDGHRVLGPLSSEEVREIARQYAGDEVEEVPLDALERATDRLPGRVHAVMSKWPDLGLEPRHRGPLVIGGGLALVAATIAAVAITSGGSGPKVAANSVAVLDPSSGDVRADIPVGSDPTDVSQGLGGIWVRNTGDQSISHIDAKTMRVVGTTAPATSVDGLAVGAGGIWTTDVRRALALRLDPAFRNPVARIRISRYGGEGVLGGPVAVGDHSVWVGNGDAGAVEIKSRTDRVRSSVDVGNDPNAIALGGSGVWVADDFDNTVVRIDPSGTPRVTDTIAVGESPSAIALGAGGLWVANSQDDTVTRIDPSAASVTATIPVGQHPTGVAVGAGSVWVANSLSGTISQIDPGTNRVVKTLGVGEAPQSLVVAKGRIWVSVDASLTPAPAAAQSGGDVLRVLLAQDPADLDPTEDPADPGASYETCARLYNYPDEPAPQGLHLKAEVASGQPIVSDGGRTYIFKIRKGFRFSPPSPQPVTAAAFERAIERNLNPKTNSYAATFMGDIVGAKAYIAGRTDHLAGVSTRGNTLVVRLVQPSPDLVARLATPWFCAVPPDTPMTTTTSTVIPSAGPYYVASYTPGKSIVLRPNPNYGGSRPRHFAEIDYQIGVSPDKAIQEVESGDADYYSNTVGGNEISPASQAALAKRYGPGSAAARAGRQQYFVEPGLGVFYLMFNTNRAPFDQARLRRAVNFALDRRALAREPFPGQTGRPTDQYLPPGTPGFHDSVIYPLGGPDLKRARELAGNVDRRVVLLTCNQPACARLAEVIRKNLAAIGLHVEVRAVAISKMFEREQSPGAHFGLGEWGYFADFPDPADFLNHQFDPRLSAPWPFHDPTFERRMRAADALGGAKRYRRYASLEHDLVSRAAPAAAYASETTASFFSSRIGCQINQPIYGIDLGRLCVR